MTALRIAAASTLLTLAACGQTASEPAPVIEGAWEVDSAASELSYVSIKAGEIAETNSFETLTGTVQGNGEATVEIDLASVSTGVDIRNERMREIFFNVADNPKATVTAKIDPAAFEALGVGESLDTTLDGTLSLVGVEAPFQAEVSVTRAGPDRVIAVTDKPVIVNAAQFELVDELAELQELAGLPSITPVVPVTFSIAFQR
ncbi:YceI family protein [Erythrobacter sp. SCSIO 43205]|uniref:YceI family protein n=1 Tax=Erythrobacter sp. SCSIO 43205 TaxID=2779361 RepID=UPI001CA8C512|nr:YceI family protein [Erythrobacter sp. SCSIO 43205]UAB78660.1 YceI family protein [Erythrobacter sp. SCSIO 43205]